MGCDYYVVTVLRICYKVGAESRMIEHQLYRKRCYYTIFSPTGIDTDDERYWDAIHTRRAKEQKAHAISFRIFENGSYVRNALHDKYHDMVHELLEKDGSGISPLEISNIDKVTFTESA
jgi:hypothetical protein